MTCENQRERMGKKSERRRQTDIGPETLAALKAGLVVSVDRRNALIGQIETAIGLWLQGGDALTIHLIVMAVHQCLRDLGYPSTLQKDVGWDSLRYGVRLAAPRKG